MKKFFFGVFLALVAGNAFADLTVGGEAFGTWNALQGKGGKGKDGVDVVKDDESSLLSGPGGSAGDIGVRLRWGVNFVNENNTWGGLYQLRLTDKDEPDSVRYNRGKIWWKPIPQVKATMGWVDGIRPWDVLWGVQMNDVAGTKVDEVGGGGDLFGGIDFMHTVALELFPIEGLHIALGVPMSLDDAGTAYQQINAFAGYTIDGIAQFAVGYFGQKAEFSTPTPTPPATAISADDVKKTGNSVLWVGLNLTMVENLQVQLGGKIPLAQKVYKDQDWKLQQDFTVSAGVKYDMGDFGILSHLIAAFGGYVDNGGAEKETENGFTFGIQLSPYYNFGIVKVGADIRFALLGESKANGSPVGDDSLKLEFTPYVEKAMGGGTFNAGFQFGLHNYTNDGKVRDDNGQFYWSVPIGMHYAF